ncbi:MAG: 6-phosphofructokinase [Pseudomonadota bacterium]|nr:6-phosphofructokinase [Pseudomonadota bacterium]
MKPPYSVCFAHSGGVTTMLNATAAAFLQACCQNPDIDQVYVAQNGILGLIHNKLFAVKDWPASHWQKLAHTPSTVFGSCRKKLPNYQDDPDVYHALFSTCSEKSITHFVYQGGNDSQDTTHKINQACKQLHQPLTCIGLPKTIDNDLFGTDFSPGFPSAAKYLATSLREASLDTFAMSTSSTKVFIMEVMGRHTGWLAAASATSHRSLPLGPHIILVPECPFDKSLWLNRVKRCVEQHGLCVIVASEGIVDKATNQPLTQARTQDAFGHQQLGGVGNILAEIVHQELGYKTHVAIPDYLQRSAAHLRSGTDFACAKLLGETCAEHIGANTTGCMLGLVRESSTPVRWRVEPVDLATCANHEKKLPSDFLSADGMELTQKAYDYFIPLLQGEVYPPYQKDGLPDYLSPLSLSILSDQEQTA